MLLQTATRSDSSVRARLRSPPFFPPPPRRWTFEPPCRYVVAIGPALAVPQLLGLPSEPEIDVQLVLAGTSEDIRGAESNPRHTMASSQSCSEAGGSMNPAGLPILTCVVYTVLVAHRLCIYVLVDPTHFHNTLQAQLTSPFSASTTPSQNTRNGPRIPSRHDKEFARCRQARHGWRQDPPACL